MYVLFVSYRNMCKSPKTEMASLPLKLKPSLRSIFVV